MLTGQGVLDAGIYCHPEAIYFLAEESDRDADRRHRFLRGTLAVQAHNTILFQGSSIALKSMLVCLDLRASICAICNKDKSTVELGGRSQDGRAR